MNNISSISQKWVREPSPDPRKNHKGETFDAVSPISLEELISRWDRYLGMTAAMTQVPVPTAIPRVFSYNP